MQVSIRNGGKPAINSFDVAQWKQFAASIQNEKEIILICVVRSCLLNEEENFARESHGMRGKTF